MDQGTIRLICGVLGVVLIALIMMRRRNRAGSENEQPARYGSCLKLPCPG